MFDENPEPMTREKRVRHVLFGILVCTGMAHLVLTTFEVPDISYIRIFVIGAVYVSLGLVMKFGKESTYVPWTFVAAALGMMSGFLEIIILGGHHTAMTLLVFDVAIMYYALRHRTLMQMGVGGLPFENTTEPSAQ